MTTDPQRRDPVKFTDKDRSFLKLLLRSPDIGDGWRKVSSVVWPLVLEFPHPELIRLRNGCEVRLSKSGLVLVDYL